MFHYIVEKTQPGPVTLAYHYVSLRSGNTPEDLAKYQALKGWLEVLMDGIPGTELVEIFVEEIVAEVDHLKRTGEGHSLLSVFADRLDWVYRCGVFASTENLERMMEWGSEAFCLWVVPENAEDAIRVAETTGDTEGAKHARCILEGSKTPAWLL